MDRIKVAMMMEEIGMIPLFFHSDPEIAINVVKACYEGGAKLLEFTSRGEFAHEVFAEISHYCKANLPGMVLGVGSVTDGASASLYMQMGAKFIVTPVLREDIALVCNRRKVLWAPGCGSLGEIGRAEELGCEIVKLFPGSTYGPGFVKAVRGPQPWTKIMPTGGVSPEESNLRGWFDAGVTCVGMGSKLISSTIVKNKDYAGLKKSVEETLQLIKKIRS